MNSALVTNYEESFIYEKFKAEEIPINLGVWEIQKEQKTKANAKDTVGSAALKERSTALRMKNQQLRLQYIDKYLAAFSSILMLQGLFLVLPVVFLIKSLRHWTKNIKRHKPLKIWASKYKTIKILLWVSLPLPLYKHGSMERRCF